MCYVPQAAALRHLGLSLAVKMQCTDASTAADLAARVHGLEVATTCYPHTKRSISEKRHRGKVNGGRGNPHQVQKMKTAWIEKGLDDIHAMHCCVTFKQLAVLFDLTMANWRAETPSQKVMADWFENGHDTIWKKHFFVRAAGPDYPLMDANANGVEAMHKKLTRVEGVAERGSLTNFLSATLPTITGWASLTLAARGWVLQPEVIPTGMIDKVQQRKTLARRTTQALQSADGRQFYMLSGWYTKTYPEVSCRRCHRCERLGGTVWGQVGSWSLVWGDG